MAFDVNTPLAANHIAADLAAINANWELTAVGVVTTAGDTVYATASKVLTRLAIGAANLKQFVNAAGTAPEWAVGIDILNFTRDMTAASGNVSYTALGFKPSNIALIAALASGAAPTSSVGFANASRASSISAIAANQMYGLANTPIHLVETWNTAIQSAVLASLDTDGFTLTWTKTGSPSAGSAVCSALCWR